MSGAARLRPGAEQAERIRLRGASQRGRGSPGGRGEARMAGMLNVLVTMRFDGEQLDRLRAVSPEISVSQADPDAADYSKTHVLYAGAPPRDLSRAPALRWVQLHMAGVNALADHPLYTDTTLPLTTTSEIHAATIAEYALTMLLALAHRVPRMVQWQGRGGWPPDEQRWPLFVPTRSEERRVGKEW